MTYIGFLKPPRTYIHPTSQEAVEPKYHVVLSPIEDLWHICTCVGSRKNNLCKQKWDSQPPIMGGSKWWDGTYGRRVEVIKEQCSIGWAWKYVYPAWKLIKGKLYLIKIKFMGRGEVSLEEPSTAAPDFTLFGFSKSMCGNILYEGGFVVWKKTHPVFFLSAFY